MTPCRRATAAGVFLALVPLSSLAVTADDSLGPVASWRGHTVVNAEGVQADAINFAPPTAQAWNPSWFSAKGATSGSTVFLQRSLAVANGSPLRQAVLKVSGDQSYRLWVNGTLVVRGPDDAGSDVPPPVRWTHQWLYNTVDITPYLHAGENVVSVEVVNASVLSAFSLGKTGFAFAASLRYQDGRQVTEEGMKGWRGMATQAYAEGKLRSTPALEGLSYDAGAEPSGWPGSVASDAPGWSAAQAVPSVWGTLQPSRIPARMEALWPAAAVDNATGPLSREGDLTHVAEGITATGDASFTVRFGRVISAYLAMQIEAESDTTVTLVPKETAGQQEIARPVEIRLHKGVTTWESPFYDAFSQVDVRLTHVSAPVHVRFVRAVFTSQPVIYRGAFESSDDHLNALWKAARWQTQISLQDRFLDSPNHQEPIGDPGDYLIASAQNDYAFGDAWMEAQNLRQFAALLDQNKEVTFHASYPLYWVQMLRQYYDRTGDAALVAELAPSVDRLLAHLGTYRGANGLISEAPNYMFMDWIIVEGYNLHHPPAVIGQGYFSALYYEGLRLGAQLDDIAGRTTKAREHNSEAEALQAAFERELWDATAGLYRDGKPFQSHQPLIHYLPADRNIETHTDQVNLFAVLYGLAPPERAGAIMAKLTQRDHLQAQPYFMHFAFAAEAKAGVFNAVAWRQLQQWHLNPETGTFREMWTAGDWSHSWGGTPLVQMSSRVLGVTPGSPGYARVAIAPHPIGLAWAKGDVPTPKGPVHVEWKRTDRAIELRIVSPAQVPADIDLAGFGGVRDISLDGAPRAGNGEGRLSLDGGEHVVRMTSAP